MVMNLWVKERTRAFNRLNQNKIKLPLNDFTREWYITNRGGNYEYYHTAAIDTYRLEQMPLPLATRPSGVRFLIIITIILEIGKSHKQKINLNQLPGLTCSSLSHISLMAVATLGSTRAYTCGDGGVPMKWWRFLVLAYTWEIDTLSYNFSYSCCIK